MEGIEELLARFAVRISVDAHSWGTMPRELRFSATVIIENAHLKLSSVGFANAEKDDDYVAARKSAAQQAVNDMLKKVRALDNYNGDN